MPTLISLSEAAQVPLEQVLMALLRENFRFGMYCTWIQREIEDRWGKTVHRLYLQGFMDALVFAGRLERHKQGNQLRYMLPLIQKTEVGP